MKALPLFILCYFVCIGCTHPERDRAALLERELAETPILAPQFDSLMQYVRQLPSMYQVGILMNAASRDEGRKSVAKQEALVLEALPLASKKEKKKLLLLLTDYYDRYGSFSPIEDVLKSVLRVEELEEQYSLSQKERWKIKRIKALALKNLADLERSLSVYFELLAEHRAANEPALVIEDLSGIAPILVGLGDYEQALSLCKEAYQLAVDHQLLELQKECSRNLVFALYDLGQYAEVIHCFQETKIDFFASSEYHAYSRLADCHLHLNRPDSARFYLEKMVQGSAEDRDAQFYERIAETYLAESREDSATAAIAKAMECFQEQAKRFEKTETMYPFPPSFLPLYSSYATLLHRNGKNREALEAFLLVEPLMNQATAEDAILADQMEALTRFSSFCRATHQYEKVSDLLAQRDSLRIIYNDMMSRRDSKRITDRFKTQELVNTIEKQQVQLVYSNRILAIVTVATLLLGCGVVILVILYRQRRRQLSAIKYKDREIGWLRSDAASSPLPIVSILSPQEELFRIAEQRIFTEKLFLNKSLSLELLARELETNRSYLSSAINSYSGSNFNQWLNGYRIQYILERIGITDDLIQLADEAGFASTNSFYRNFKRCTGMTPSEYLKEKRGL